MRPTGNSKALARISALSSGLAQPWKLCAIGCALALSGAAYSYVFGTSYLVLCCFAASLVVCGYAFYARKNRQCTLTLSAIDLAAICGLLIVFAPLYLSFNYEIPVQVNTDEPTIMVVAKELLSAAHPDVFGLTSYFQYPSFIFILFGKLGQLLGGIDLLHMRLVHALCGILIVILSYLFFRVLLSRHENQSHAVLWSICGAVLVGSQHALLAVSRMAMRDNTALLLELPALTCAYLAFVRNDPWYAFLAGVLGGFSCYNYLPGRIVLPLSLFAIAVLWLSERKRYSLRAAGVIAATMLLGAFLVTLPLISTTLKASHTEFSDVRHKLLIFPEAREEQRKWVGAESTAEGMFINLVQGLAGFNLPIHDHNYIYLNRGHGFLDPLTGILLWVGLIAILGRRTIELPDLLVITCFVTLWLTLTLLFNKNPHYNRLLSLIPFIAYLALEGIRTAALHLRTLRKRPPAPKSALLAGPLLVALIAMWNLGIYSDFVRTGFENGDSVGSTARYVEARADISPYHFYLIANTMHPYYDWGSEWNWNGWLGFFVSPTQQYQIVAPERFSVDALERPFTLFMSEGVWHAMRAEFTLQYPYFEMHTIKRDRPLVAIEVK